MMKISFDLDETLFVNPAEVPTEPELKFPYNKLYRDRLRKGAVELLKEINESDTHRLHAPLPEATTCRNALRSSSAMQHRTPRPPSASPAAPSPIYSCPY